MTKRERSDPARRGSGFTLLELLVHGYALADWRVIFRIVSRLECLAR